MYKPHHKPKSKTSDISKQSPSPLHHTFLLGRARLTAQPLSALLLPVLENFRPAFSPNPTDCPWVSEDVDNILSKMMTVVKTSNVQFCMTQQINTREKRYRYRYIPWDSLGRLSQFTHINIRVSILEGTP